MPSDIALNKTGRIIESSAHVGLNDNLLRSAQEMNPPLAFCQPNTGLPLIALGSLAAQESIILGWLHPNVMLSSIGVIAVADL